MLSHTYARSGIIVFFSFFYDELVVTTKLVQSASWGLHSLRTCSIVSVYLISTQSHVLQSQCPQQGVNVVSPITSTPFSFGLWNHSHIFSRKAKRRSL